MSSPLTLTQTLIDRYFIWRSQRASLAHKIFLSLGMASITGLAAQMRIPLPFTPVPVTAQTVVVLLSGLLLGRKWGAASQVFYITLGACGIPLFAGWGWGLSHLAGPTGGYIAGFVLAAFFVGYITDVPQRSPGFLSVVGYMLLANFLLIHGMGLIQLYLWLALIKGAPVGIVELISIGTLPFVPGDIVKAFAAATLARTFIRKQK